MAIKLSGNKSLIIVDRTLTEISDKAANVYRMDIISFCWMLNKLGCDFIEVNTTILRNIKKIPQGLKFLLKVENLEDAHFCIEKDIKYCCMDEEKGGDLQLVSRLTGAGIDITVEVPLDRLGNFIKRHSDKEGSLDFKNIRIVDLKTVDDIEGVIRSIKEVANREELDINICASDDFFNAAAITMEAAEMGFYSVTTAFGVDKNECENKYASTEEVMTLVKTMINPKYKIDYNALYDAEECFQRICGMEKQVPKRPVHKNILNSRRNAEEKSLSSLYLKALRA